MLATSVQPASPISPGGMLRGMALVVVLLFLPRPTPAQPHDAAATTVLTVEGTVEFLPAGSAMWTPAKPSQTLRPGDQVRTGARSRATLRLSNLSVMRVSELMAAEILPPARSGSQPVLDLKAGKAYFLSRDKAREFQLRTPTATAAIRGTEFNVEVSGNRRTVVTLIDGEVELENDQGKVTLASGEQGTVEAGQAPARTAALQTINIIQWILYYPAVIDANELALTAEERQGLAESLDAYRSGDLLAALERYPAGRAPASDAEKVYRAGVLLAAGLVEQSERLLQGIDSPQANALRQLLAAVRFQERVPAATPASASAWLAESYYQQSRSQLPKALSAARAASQRSSKWGFAWVRVAELEFSFGRTADAFAALEKGLASSPRHAEGWALRGFLLSARNRINEAEAAFERAIELDGALGNGWLGRGLMHIRRGELEEGRKDLQVAAVLEPQRSVLRSYVGKAFGEEGELRLALKELELAARLDPNDPTSWLYKAILDHQQNRVNKAMRDLERSQDLNENRRVFRSRLLLDQDQAVRSANLASFYRDAGMFEVSAREASRALNSDYGNYSGHLFLANSYDELRDPRLINLRYETPWFTELLLAQLLAPVGAGNLSRNVSQQEYSRLFERDHFGVSSRLEYLSSGDWSQRGSQFGTVGNTGYSIDSEYRRELGQRTNNDVEAVTLSATVKQQLTPEDSVMVQAIYSDYESGDVAQYYDPRSASTGLRIKERQEPLLLAGYHREWAPGLHTLFLGGRFVDQFKITDPQQRVLLQLRDTNNQVTAISRPNLPTAALDYQSDLLIYSAELQQMFQFGMHGLVLGGRFQTGTFDTSDSLGASTPGTIGNNSATSGVAFVTAPIAQDISSDFERVNAYAYHHWRVWEPLLLTAGVSYDHLRFPANHRSPPISSREESTDRVSPKAGVTWEPTKDTTARFAYTRSLGGLTFDQSVRLEPSQVAGFNQAFRSLISESIVGSTAGARFETFSLGLDQKFKTGTYLGVETERLKSRVDRIIAAVDLTLPPASAPSSTQQSLDYEERVLLVTLHQLVGEHVTLGARYRLIDAELDTRFGDIPDTVATSRSRTEATLHQANLYALYNHPCGFFSSLEGIWSAQSNRGYQPAQPGDEFWQFNVYAGWRFARRRVEARAGLLNVTDRPYQLNPLTLYAELPRERTFAARLQFNF